MTRADRGAAVRLRDRVALPTLAALVAAVVFGNGLGRLPLWRDEVASVDIAARPVPAILAAAGRIDVVHTAYYLLLHGVVGWGQSEALVRLPSLLAMVAAVTLVVTLARARLGAVPAVVAGALLIGNPWLAYYAREARPYALATALVCAAAAVLLGGPPSRRRVVAFTLLAVGATWVHLFDMLPLVGLALGCIAVCAAHRARPVAATWLVCALAAAVATAPLAVLAARESGQVSWITAPTGDDVHLLLADVAGSGAAEFAIAALLVVGAASTAPSWWSRHPRPGRGAADTAAVPGGRVSAAPPLGWRGAPVPAGPAPAGSAPAVGAQGGPAPVRPAPVDTALVGAAPAGFAPVGPTVLVPALLGAVSGPVVLLGVSWWGVPLYVERYVLASAPLVALAAAAAVALVPGAFVPSSALNNSAPLRDAQAAPSPPGADTIWPPLATGGGVQDPPRASRAGRETVRAGVRMLVAAAVVIVALTGVPAAVAGPADKTEDLRAGAAFLAAQAQPGDCVAYAPGWTRVGVAYYLRRTSAQLRDVALDPDRPVVGLFPDEFPLDVVEAHLLTCRRLWVVGYPGSVGRWRPVPETTTTALAVVAPDFATAAPTTFGDLTAALWTAGPRVR